MKPHRLAAHLLCSTVFAACGGAPAPQAPTPGFIRSTAIVEHSPPIVEAAPSANDDDSLAPDIAEGHAAEPADTSPPPLAAAAPELPAAPPRAPDVVLAHANQLASRAPDEDGFVNALTPYAYEPGAFYKIFTAPFRVTDIRLEPGEQLLGPIMGGDPVRWRVEVGSGAVAGVPQTHVFLKPSRPGLATNITLTTDRRTYLLDVESLEDSFMVSVQWTYPGSDMTEPSAAATAVAPPPPSAPATEVSQLRFDYAIEVAEGKPAWKPRVVYDDGAKTFIRFQRSFLTGEAPVLYVIERGEAQLVNYRIKDTLYIVDRLFDVAELRLGKDDQDVVRICNRSASSARALNVQRRAARNDR